MEKSDKKEKKTQFTIMLEPSIIEEIRTLSEKLELPARTLGRNLLMNGLDDARALDKVGLLRLFGMTRKQIDKTLKKLGLTLDGLDVLNED